ncbi:MAG: HPP family protein [Magnetococcales bacterium]|nr:HPP family protein [Magnetococcales bacterium]
MRPTSVAPPTVSSQEILWSFLGSMVSIGLLSWIHFTLLPADQLLLVGSFGASAVLVHGAITSPLAQPRNLVGGHLLSALVGVVCYKLLGDIPWLAAPLAVSGAIALMQLTRTLHPPGGATALLAVIGSPELRQLGFLYPLMPAASGALIMLTVALLFNNLAPTRRYPLFWW